MVGRVAVLGAGISGLTIAWELMQRGIQVDCYDRSNNAGGVIQTQEWSGFRYEHGPTTVQASSRHVMGLIDRLGMRDRVVYSSPSAKDRFIYRDGKVRKLPSGPSDLLSTDALSMGGKLRMLAEPLMRKPATPDPQESIARFVERRLGREAVDYLLDPFVSGIYAGDPKELEVASAFPQLVALEQEHGSLLKAMLAAKKVAKTRGEDPSAKPKGLLSFREGLHELPKELTRQLGGALHLGMHTLELLREDKWWAIPVARSTTRYEQVVLACPARAAAGYLSHYSEPLAAELHAIPYAPVSVIHLGYRREDLPQPLEGFGCLIPRNQGIALLGCIYTSSLFPDRAPDGAVLLSCFVGGVLNPDIVLAGRWGPSEKQVLLDLGRVFGITTAPGWSAQVDWPAAIPQYVIGHGERKARIRALVADLPNVHLASNYLEGISLDATVAEAVRVAESIAAG